jgi:two-component system OmpR family sensor kinase
MSRLPLRIRLTLGFTLVIAIVLGLTGLFLYLRFQADLNNTIERGLRTRSEEVSSLVRHTDDGLATALAQVTGGGDDFAQVLDSHGSLIATTPQVPGEPLLKGSALRRAVRSPLVAQHAPIGGLDGPLRLRAAPLDTGRGRLVVVVGTSLGERDDSLRTLAALLGVGGAVALVLAAIAGYALAAGALRPVDSMRRRAAAISPSQSGHRLPVPPSRDEIARLGETLNDMLARLETASARERAFLADASHELRTPLGILKAELELAQRRGRSPQDLRAALASAAEETDRLVRLAEDLLVIARLDQGRLPVRSTEIDAGTVLGAVAERFNLSAGDRSRNVRAADGAGVQIFADRVHLEQALGNMVDNALRHGAGEVRLTAVGGADVVELHVIDEGPGFAADFIDHAFERFARADGSRRRGGAGLGLSIVTAIAASHGGRARVANRPGGGADVWLELPASPAASTVALSAT